jgi:hypothetical protein
MTFAALIVATIFITLLALAYAWLGWSACRRWGPKALIGLWITAAAAFAACGALQAARAGARVKPEHASELGWQAFALFFVVGLAAFGGATLSIRRRAREGTLDRWTARLAIRAVGAFFAGLGVSLLPALLAGLGRLR